jgi:hypothetical protein
MGVESVQGINGGKDMLAQGERVVTEKGRGLRSGWICHCAARLRVQRCPQWSCLSVSRMSVRTG